ncbi:MAG: Holliday junction resolvase RuvX [Polyangiales bacterium]|nr:Holliday junction resolvase RuvX [Myxococcales bacterium]MCB9602297.1 Holliday junction resolvase RuvX [Sandaracinus sp.]
MERVLGVDPGRARIGLALSDEASGRLALPFGTVVGGADSKAAAKRVKEALVEVEISELVVGLPLRLDGSEGESARRARKLGDAIGKVLGKTPHYWDERLTTALAERGLKEVGLDGRARRKVVDQSAAALILQGWLDARAHREERER